MWNPLTKNNPLNGVNSRVHIEQPLAIAGLQKSLTRYLSYLYDNSTEIIILCIGTDRSTGDSLGPLVGSKLIELGFGWEKVYGTLEKPVHAVNLQETINEIYLRRQKSFIIAIDACLGRSESVGFISIKEGPLQPGTGVNKELPAVGDLQIIGVVNIGGFMEYMVLQNTRLNLVMKMAEIISRGLYFSIQNQELFKLTPEELANTKNPVPT